MEKRSFCRNLFLVTSLNPNVLICLTLCLYCLFSRSLCTVVCKWTYTSDRGWDDSFWKMIGLEDLVKDKYEKIGISEWVLIYIYIHINKYTYIFRLIKSFMFIYVKDINI